jgi:RES domain-containing protein
MSLLFFDGFDNAALVQKPEWDTSNLWVSRAGRDGSTNGGATFVSSTGSRILVLPSPAATCIFGGAFMLTTSGQYGSQATNSYFVAFRIGVNTHLVVSVDAAGRVQLKLSSGSGTVLATATGSPIVLNQWTHLQVKTILHTTAGSCELRINGQTVISYTGQTATSSGAVAAIAVANMNATNGVPWDDVWVCDAVDATATQGRPNNDFLGDLTVTTLLPTAPGAATGWTPSAGENWTTVNENPPSTAQGVTAAAGVSGTRDLYDASDLPVTAVGVYALRGGLYASKSDAGTANVKTVLRESGGGITTQTAKTLPTAAGGVFGDTVYLKSNSSLWTPADVNAVQIGQETA